MFKKRPTFTRYTVTYNVKYFLKYVKKCSISIETSLQLTSKVSATMMCLFSGQKSQTLVSLSTDCIYLDNSGCVFYISKLFKTSRPKSHLQPKEFKTHPYDVSLCVVALIKLYLDKAAALKHDVNSISFISYAPLHKPVSSKALAWWVSAILHESVFIPKHSKFPSLSIDIKWVQWWFFKDSWKDKCKDVWQLIQ